MVYDIIYMGQFLLGTWIAITRKDEVSSIASYPEYPNLPYGEGTKGERDPSSKLQKDTKGQNCSRVTVGM